MYKYYPLNCKQVFFSDHTVYVSTLSLSICRRVIQSNIIILNYLYSAISMQDGLSAITHTHAREQTPTHAQLHTCWLPAVFRIYSSACRVSNNVELIKLYYDNYPIILGWPLKQLPKVKYFFPVISYLIVSSHVFSLTMSRLVTLILLVARVRLNGLNRFQRYVVHFNFASQESAMFPGG